MAKKKIDKQSLGNMPINEPLNEAPLYYHRKQPYLVTRFGVGLLDLLVSIALVVGIQYLLAFLLFGPMGYYSAHDAIIDDLASSHLYYKTNENNYESFTIHYDDSLTPEENYEVPILYYYENCDYPMSKDALTNYERAKANSGFWVNENGSWRRNDVTWEVVPVKAFLASQYEDACTLLENNPSYIKNVNHMVYVTYFTLLMSITIGSMPAYLIFPLLNKNGATPFQMIFKIGLADKCTDSAPKKSQIVLRYIFLLAFDFLLPEVWWYFFGTAKFGFGIPFFIDLAFMCLAPNNISIHDFISKTYVVSCRDEMGDPLSDLKQEKKKKEKEEENRYLDGKVENNFFD